VSADTNEIVTVDYRRSVEPVTNTTNHFDDCYNRDAYGWYDEKIDAYRVERGSIINLVLEGNRAVRASVTVSSTTYSSAGAASLASATA
jgi:hypothetical protein